MSTKVEVLHPCNIDPLVPELVRREPHNTHTCQSTECTAESYACSQTNYINSQNDLFTSTHQDSLIFAYEVN